MSDYEGSGGKWPVGKKPLMENELREKQGCAIVKIFSEAITRSAIKNYRSTNLWWKPWPFTVKYGNISVIKVVFRRVLSLSSAIFERIVSWVISKAIFKKVIFQFFRLCLHVFCKFDPGTYDPGEMCLPRRLIKEQDCSHQSDVQMAFILIHIFDVTGEPLEVQLCMLNQEWSTIIIIIIYIFWSWVF